MCSWKGRNRAGKVLGSTAGRPVEKEGLITMENSNFAVIYDCKNHCIVKTHPGGYLKNAKKPLILG